MTEGFEIIEIDSLECTNNERKTSSIMTKYEYTKLIALRAHQISMTADVKLDMEEIKQLKFDPIELAKRELWERTLPFAIKRKLPNGEEEIWKIDEMEICDY